MYFEHCVSSKEQLGIYVATCKWMSNLILNSVDYLLTAFNATEEGIAKLARRESEFHHGSALMLAKHVIEMTDAVAVLVENGCGHPAKPLLRSSFEALIGLLYMLKADSRRRGLAYQVAHAHQRIRMYRLLDDNTPEGKQFIADVQGDSVFSGIKFSKQDFAKLIANLNSFT